MKTHARMLLQAALPLAALLAQPLVRAQETNAMTIQHDNAALAQRLIDLHFDIWNDTEPHHWTAKFPQVYTADFSVADAGGIATGYDAVGRLIQKVQGAHAGFTFTPDPVTWNHDTGRVTWGYGPHDDPDRVRGEDVFTIKDGKLGSARVFIDKK